MHKTVKPGCDFETTCKGFNHHLESHFAKEHL
jgi:hypothetical protein